MAIFVRRSKAVEPSYVAVPESRMSHQVMRTTVLALVTLALPCTRAGAQSLSLDSSPAAVGRPDTATPSGKDSSPPPQFKPN